MSNPPQIQTAKSTDRPFNPVLQFSLIGGIFFASLAAVRFAPLLAFAMAPFGISWDSMFFLPQVAFPNDFIDRTVAAEIHIPLVTAAFWTVLGLAFAALTARRKIWQLLFLAPATVYIGAYAFAYGLRRFGIQIHLDGP